jgi:hypothetical protein
MRRDPVVPGLNVLFEECVIIDAATHRLIRARRAIMSS